MSKHVGRAGGRRRFGRPPRRRLPPVAADHSFEVLRHEVQSAAPTAQSCRAEVLRPDGMLVRRSAMKLGLQLGYWGAQPNPFAVSLAQEAERLGFDSVWTAEAWGSDAFTPLAWIGAHTERIRLCTGIVQISARTPRVVRHARAHARSPVERPVHARARRLGSAGGGGLVRPAVRQAARTDARVHRHRAARAAPRGAGRVRG